MKKEFILKEHNGNTTVVIDNAEANKKVQDEIEDKIAESLEDIRKAAKDFVDKHIPFDDWETTCKTCGEINCKSN